MAMLADVTLETVDGFPVARVQGEVDMSNAAEVGRTLRSALEHVGVGLVIDFTPTAYLDSAGLHFIFELGRRLRDRGQRLHLVVPEGSPVAAVLDIVHVDTVAPRVESVPEAIERMRALASDVPPPPPA